MLGRLGPDPLRKPNSQSPLRLEGLHRYQCDLKILLYSNLIEYLKYDQFCTKAPVRLRNLLMRDGQFCTKTLVGLCMIVSAVCMSASEFCPHVVLVDTSRIMRMWTKLWRGVLLFLGRVREKGSPQRRLMGTRGARMVRILGEASGVEGGVMMMPGWEIECGVGLVMRTLLFFGIGWLSLLTMMIERLVLDRVDSLLMKRADQEIDRMCQPLTTRLTTSPDGSLKVENAVEVIMTRTKSILEFRLAGDLENENVG
jgi:hypothetical protein